LRAVAGCYIFGVRNGLATVGDASQFASGREMAASFGLTPKQNSSGGKGRLLGIGKRGDAYLRSLLVQKRSNVNPL
jgi:transposase